MTVTREQRQAEKGLPRVNGSSKNPAHVPLTHPCAPWRWSHLSQQSRHAHEVTTLRDGVNWATMASRWAAAACGQRCGALGCARDGESRGTGVRGIVPPVP